MTYATGRAMRFEDQGADAAALASAQERFEAGDLRFADLVMAIVTSEPFQYKGPPPPPEADTSADTPFAECAP
jgi:hypothetical protein